MKPTKTTTPLIRNSINRSPLRRGFVLMALAFACFALSPTGAQTLNQSTPSWWNKYQHLLKNGAESGGGATSSLSVGANVHGSNDCGPQSETNVTLNPDHPTILAGGSNEIFPLPNPGYFFSNSGRPW